MIQNKTFPKWQFYKASKVYSLFALVFLLAGLFILTSVTTLPKNQYKPVLGIVVENTHNYLSKNIMKNTRIRYMNTIEYKVNGETYRLRSNSTPFGRSPMVLPVGKIVDIRYNPDIPAEAYIKNNATDAVLVGVGLIFIIASLCLIAAIYRRYNMMHSGL